jgi:membrane protein YqaA with SNARE-associated domain
MGKEGRQRVNWDAWQGADSTCSKFQQSKLPSTLCILMEAALQSLLHALALPEYGLSTVFVVAFVSATLLPLGSEPAVFGLVKLNAHLLWPAIGVATLGNTLGGMTSWWLGRAAHNALDRWRDSPTHAHALRWLERMGPKACVLSFLPLVGDPLCAVAGWLRLPALPCAGWMAVGKFARYVTMTTALLWLWPQPA